MKFSTSMFEKKTSFGMRSVGRFLVNPSSYLIPKRILHKADSERGLVDDFIFSLENAKGGERLLDAGAGSFRYEKILTSKGYLYESQDFSEVFDSESRGKHTYVCDITNIPVEESRFDIIICTQVLEHLVDPRGAFTEFSRILKPGGVLMLTTNFLFPIHGAPYDYFRFTVFGLQNVCEASGFSPPDISPRGGFFAFTAKIVFDFPAIIKSWLFYGNADPHGPTKIQMRHPILIVLSLPFVFVLDLTFSLLAFFISTLDFLDKKNRFTLGYQLTTKAVKFSS